jgi:hypothetical protein
MTIVRCLGVTTLVALMSADRVASQQHQSFNPEPAEATKDPRCDDNSDRHSAVSYRIAAII